METVFIFRSQTRFIFKLQKALHLSVKLFHNNMSKKKLILDVDAGSDDALAILLAAHAQQKQLVQILGITCVNGNTSVDNVCVNVLRTLETIGFNNIPVYCGATEPLIPTDPPKRFHGTDGFGDLHHKNDIDPARIQEENAIVALNRIVQQNPGEISVVAIGPLTNLALAMKTYKGFSKNVKEIYIMGGNYTGIGNATQSAEFNFHTDPEAAHIVLHSAKCPVTIFPWETCLKCPLPFEWRFTELVKIDTPIMRLLNAVEEGLYGPDEKNWRPCDAYLMAVVFQPSLVTLSKNYYACVELSGSKTRGQMVIDHLKKSEPNVTVVEEINVDLFKTLLLQAAALH